ncbi:hypothetical protein AnigIFM63309_000400 [Aspergillus niger]|nr:hypothetical protein AnigIFM62618_008567 [Aspergillus niger]GLA33569.1 hypothetical protein AnigIFM63309_000400 [Aspergillus niger]
MPPADNTPNDYQRSELRSGAVIHIWGHENPRAIIILQHGFAEYAERYLDSYCRLIPSLLAHDYKVYALDLWGHGRSPGKRSVLNVERAISDHNELRRRVFEEHPSRPIFLFGHSLGGLITAVSLTTDPSHVAGIILTGAALPAQAPIIRSVILQPLAALAPTLRLRYTRVQVENACQRPEEYQKCLNDSMVFKGHISLRLGATALRAAEKLWQAIDSWTVPTLIMHGTKDTYTAHEQSKVLFDGIHASDKTLILAEGGYHELLNDLDNKQHLASILSWLERRTKSTVVHK